jgi:hypothetical protein
MDLAWPGLALVERHAKCAKAQFEPLALDGACPIGTNGRPRFVATAAPMPTWLHALRAAMIARLMRLFVSRGVVVAEPDLTWIEETQARDGDDATGMALADGPSALQRLNQASTTYRVLNAWSNFPASPLSHGGKSLPDLGAAGLRGDRRA